MIHHDILAIHVERRSVAIAAFSGLNLDFADVRELAADTTKAALSTRRYLHWAIETFKPGSIAVERPHGRSGKRRDALTSLAYASTFGQPISRVLIRPSVVREAMGNPPLRSRRELHQVGSSLWPRLPGTRHPSAYDAALLGLHFQMIDLFLP
jgi:hypothetical protein